MLNAQSLQSCPTLCDLTDGSLPGSSVQEIPQASLLEWAAISSSRETFPTQGLNPCLLCWQADSLALSLPGSPVLDWYACNFLFPPCSTLVLSYSPPCSVPRIWLICTTSPRSCYQKASNHTEPEGGLFRTEGRRRQCKNALILNA